MLIATRDPKGSEQQCNEISPNGRPRKAAALFSAMETRSTGRPVKSLGWAWGIGTQWPMTVDNGNGLLLGLDHKPLGHTIAKECDQLKGGG